MIHTVLRDLVEKQQFSAVKSIAEKSLREAEDRSVLPMLILAESRLGNLDYARSALQELVEDHQGLNQEGLMDLSSLLMMNHRYLDVAKVLEPLVEPQNENAQLMARSGFAKMMLGELDIARSRLEQSFKLDPEQVPVLSNLTSICLRQGDLSTANHLIQKGFGLLETKAAEMGEKLYQSAWQSICGNQLHLWILKEEYAQIDNWLRGEVQRQQSGEIEESAVVHWILQYSQYLAQSDRHEQASEALKEYAKTYPDNVDICLRLAELARLQGYNLPAMHLLRRAISKDKDNVALWVQLSNVCLHQFPEQASSAAQKARELAQSQSDDEGLPEQKRKMQVASALTAVAMSESDQQNFDAARELFSQVIEQHPQFVPALQGLGHQLMQEGSIDEAVALFEQVKQINPAQGISALINARQFPEDETVLERMHLAAMTPSMQGSEKSGMLFQLAAAWESRKDYEKAFQMASEANAASRKLLRYKPEDHRNACARVRHSFCPELYQNRANFGSDSRVPVYVVGMPRSGTTLVEQILSGHSKIFGAGELGVIPQVIQGLNRWERYVGSGRLYPDCVDDLTGEVVDGIANKVLSELKEYSADAEYIVDKLPHNFENIGLIKFLFPEAKIISVRRDPRDIAISNFFTDYQAKMGGMGFAYDLSDIGEQLADHNLMMHHWHQVFPDQVLEVQYEDVVDNLEQTARTMLEYVGVDWEPEVLSFNQLDRAVKTASVWQVRQPIYKSSKAKWRNYEEHLAPLIEGTNKKIQPDPVEMVTLPEAGFLTDGVALFKEGKLDEAEMSFKKMLHHNPEHAACNYMVGLIYLQKGYLEEGIEKIEAALEKAPWHREWIENLVKACRLSGDDKKADQLEERMQRHLKGPSADQVSVASADADSEEFADNEIAGMDPLGPWRG